MSSIFVFITASKCVWYVISKMLIWTVFFQWLQSCRMSLSERRRGVAHSPFHIPFLFSFEQFFEFELSKYQAICVADTDEVRSSLPHARPQRNAVWEWHLVRITIDRVTASRGVVSAAFGGRGGEPDNEQGSAEVAVVSVPNHTVTSTLPKVFPSLHSAVSRHTLILSLLPYFSSLSFLLWNLPFTPPPCLPPLPRLPLPRPSQFHLSIIDGWNFV